MLHQEKELPDDSRSILNFINFTDQMAAAKKQSFLQYLYESKSSPTVNESPGFTNDYKFGISLTLKEPSFLDPSFSRGEGSGFAPKILETDRNRGNIMCGILVHS